MAASAEPIIVTISHKLGRDGAKQRIGSTFDSIRAELAPYVRTFDYAWDENYRLNFRASAMMQTISGDLEVFDDFVRVSVMLPGLLHVIGKVVASRIEQRGRALLDAPKS